MKLSEKICCCRKKCGYSQETLAQMLGVSRQAVSKWETGESEPETGKLKLLAAAPYRKSRRCVPDFESPVPKVKFSTL